MGVKRYELDEVQWSRIAPLLPGKVSDPGRTGSDNRLFVNGVLWVLRSGAHWQDLPERYGKWKTAHIGRVPQRFIVGSSFCQISLSSSPLFLVAFARHHTSPRQSLVGGDRLLQLFRAIAWN